MITDRENLGKIIRQRRVTIPLTIGKLARAAGISQSHLARIETGGRFPSAHVLCKIAKPLGFSESELFIYAGYLPEASTEVEGPSGRRLDPYVAALLSQEPVATQRTVVGILTILKEITKARE